MKIEIQCGKVISQSHTVFVASSRCGGTLILDTDKMGPFTTDKVLDVISEFYVEHEHLTPSPTEDQADYYMAADESEDVSEDPHVVEFKQDPGPSRIETSDMNEVLDEIDKQVNGVHDGG